MRESGPDFPCTHLDIPGKSQIMSQLVRHSNAELRLSSDLHLVTAGRRVEADSQTWQAELAQDTPYGSPRNAWY